MATYGFSKEGRLNAIDGKATGVSDSNVVIAEAGKSSLVANPTFQEPSVAAPSLALNSKLSPM